MMLNMDISSKYTFYIGTTRGVLLSTQCKANEKLSFVKSEDTSEVTALEFGRNIKEIILGYKSGNCSIYNPVLKTFETCSTDTDDQSSVIGVGCMDNTVLAGKQRGTIDLWNETSQDSFHLGLDAESTLDCMKINHQRGDIIGTGGEKNDFKLWDIKNKKCIFKAKSLGHDQLNLPIPTSVRGMTFFPDDVHLCACATKQGYVLLYDDRAQRRPVVKFLEQKASYTTIVSVYRERQCLAGTTKGYMQLLDLRSAKCLKTFKSFTGGVTDIVCDPLEPLVASTSLDRHIRVHNLETKELVYKSYLKQNLTKLIMIPTVKEEKEEKQEIKDEVDVEYEELFNNMETVSDSHKKHKRKRLKDENLTKHDEVTKKVKRKKKKVVE